MSALSGCKVIQEPLPADLGAQYQGLSIPMLEFDTDAYSGDIKCDFETPRVHFTLETDFSVANSYLLLHVAEATYWDSERATRQFHTWGFDHVEVYDIPETGVRAYVMDNDDMVLVSYRGTKVVEDNQSNAAFVTLPADFGPSVSSQPAKVHAGFWSTHKTSRDGILTLIEAAGGYNKPVIFTGHSRGGSLAVLQAMYFARMGGAVFGVHTFAQPRLGDSALNASIAQVFGDRYYRLEHAQDVTPQMPPTPDAAEQLYIDGKIPRWMRSFISFLDYDDSGGDAYTLNQDGAITQIFEPAKTENEFWVNLFSRFPAMLFSLRELAMDFENHHKPPVYLCEMNKGYHSSRLY